MPTEIELVFTEGPKSNRITRFNGAERNITIDNDNFDDAHDFLIDKRQIDTLNFQIKNIGSSNGLSFQIYGSIDSADTAPAFALKDWELQANGSGNITSLVNKIFESKFYLIWVIIRLKRQTTLLDTTSDIVVTTGTR